MYCVFDMHILYMCRYACTCIVKHAFSVCVLCIHVCICMSTLKCMYACNMIMHVCMYCACTVGDKIKFPLCTDSPPTCERSCQQKSPKSRPKVASDFRRTLNVIKKVADLFLSGEKIVYAHIQFRPKSRACANGTRRSCNYSY